MSKKKIALGSDHAGFILKEAVKEHFKSSDFEIVDAGCHSADISVDYPDFAQKVAQGVSTGEFEKGVLVCGTGIGMSISANRYTNVRAALVTSDFQAEMTARHNSSNILVFGAKVTSVNEAKSMLKIWLATEYEGGRHDRRLEKMDKIK